MSYKQWEPTWEYETEAFYCYSSLENMLILIIGGGVAGLEKMLRFDL